MTNDTLTNLEPVLEQFLMERYWATPWTMGKPIPDHVWKSLTTHVKYLSDSFTTSRQKFSADYFKKKEARSAYLLYFHLANVARNQAVLQQIIYNDLLPRRPLRAMDLGSGLGSVAWSLLHAHRDEKLRLEELVLVDHDAKILEDSQKLYGKLVKQNLLPNIPHKYLTYNLSNPAQAKKLVHQGEFDLIISSNMLNEMQDTSARDLSKFFLQRIDEQLAEDGILVVVEPAMNKTSRVLTEVRDEMLKSGYLNTPLPCIHSGACPLNNEPRDWCHFEVSWEVPPIRERLEKSLEHGSGLLKYSYVVFKRGKKPVAPYRKKQSPYRVISDVLESRQGHAVLLCDADKKINLELGVKRLDVPEKFRKLHRGDLFNHPFEKASQKGHLYATSARLKKISEEE